MYLNFYWLKSYNKTNIKSLVSIYKSKMQVKLGHKIVGNMQGTPLAIIHGWGVDSSCLSSIAQHFNDRRVMLIDLPGYGMSKHLNQYNHDFNNTVQMLYNTLEPGTDLIAWSLSTLFAIKVCNMKPAKVNSLITICGSARFPADPNWPGMPANLIIKCKRFLTTKRAKNLISRFFRRSIMNINDYETALNITPEELELKLQELDSDTLLAGIDLMSYIDVREDLKYLKVPSLHLFGAKDLLVPPQLAKACSRENHSLTYIFPYSGHMPFLTESNTFYRVIDNFYHKFQHSN